MPAGRPSEYKSAYCNEVINLMAEGYSLTAAMGSLGFHRQTAHDWAAKYPEFSDAIKIGHAKRSMALEGKGLIGASGPAVTFAIAALKNCNREDFREQVEVEHTGSGGGPIQVAWTVVDPQSNQ